MNQQPSCDLQTGVCTPQNAASDAAQALSPVVLGTEQEPREIVYVGDPMCSWCWGMAPQLKSLQAWAHAQGIPFTVVVGGLRPGGGDAWTPQFRAFLHHHWQEVAARSDQPFVFDLLDWPAFAYDTEPPCRAIVVARSMLQEQGRADALYGFFAAIQQGFYVGNGNPAEHAFYQPICQAHALDFARFVALFDSTQAQAATRGEFDLCRRWGVQSFPAVLLRQHERLYPVARGYAHAQTMMDAVQRQLQAN